MRSFLKLFLCMALALAFASSCTSCRQHPEELQPPPTAAPPPSEFDAGEEEAELYQEGEPIPGVETVYFDYNRSEIRADQRAVLRANAAIIRQLEHRVTISGHCDERGSEEYNLALGERRANAIKNYLVDLGVAPAKLDTVSYGEAQPAAVGGTEAAWAKNRRAEFRAAR